YFNFFFFFSSRRRHTRSKRDWSSDVCSSDLNLKNDLSYLGFDPSNIHSGSYLSFAQDNTENLYLGGEISYDYKDILGISAKYTRSEERRVGKEYRSRWRRYQ